MVEITVKKTDFFTLTITMRIVATHTKGHIFAVGELLITEGCGNIFIAYHVYAERQHRRGTVFVCVFQVYNKDMLYVTLVPL